MHRAGTRRRVSFAGSLQAFVFTTNNRDAQKPETHFARLGPSVRLPGPADGACFAGAPQEEGKGGGEGLFFPFYSNDKGTQQSSSCLSIYYGY